MGFIGCSIFEQWIEDSPFCLCLGGAPERARDVRISASAAAQIYAVMGMPGDTNLTNPIGDFFVQFAGNLCAYHLPGGAFSMRFGDSNSRFVEDGNGGKFLVGTFELTILEANGMYARFAGGHNHMVDKLHFLAPGDGSGGVDEYCFCFIRR